MSTTHLHVPAPGTPHRIAPAGRAASPSTLADAIARDGIAAHEDAVARLALAARARDRAPTLAAVLLDRTAPVPARERAFGRIDWAALVAAAAGVPPARAPLAPASGAHAA